MRPATDEIPAPAGRQLRLSFGVLLSKAPVVLLILFFINLLNFFDRQLIGSLGEPIRKEFHLSDTALGFAGTIFTVIYAVVGLPLGALSDRWRRTRLIAIGTAFWSLLTAATGVAQNYAQLFASRIGVGIGEATCAPAAQSLIGDLFAPHQRARAMGVFMLGLPAGIFLAYLCAGAIGSTLGWRAAFLIACVPGFLVALLVLRVAEPVRGALDLATRSAADTPVKAPYTAVLRVSTMWWIILSGVFHNFNMYAIGAFQTSFLIRFHQMGLAAASNVSAIAVGAVGAIGLLGGGWIADKVRARRRNGRLQVAAVSMAIAAPSIFFALNQPRGSIDAYMLLMAIGMMNMYVYYATVYAAIQDVIEPRLRGTAVAIYFCAMYVLGASLGPLATGMLSDHFAHRAMQAAGAATMTEAFKASGLHDALYVVPALAALAALALIAASRTVDADIRRREAAGQ
ncbi:MAG: MFS transporter [Steroidobacteraceae bacterium]|jgi:MFS family permease